MNEPLNERERRIARLNLAWGFIGGVVATTLVVLIWEILF